MRALRATLALIACAATLAACGDSGGAAKQEGPGFGSAQALQTVTCTDWKKADPQVRTTLLRRLRDIVGGQVTGNGAAGRGNVLSDDQAYRLFDGYCRQSFARGFTLYKLYGRAAGFAGAAP